MAEGERIGPWRLVELIGTGGMGDVYKAVRDDAQYHAEAAIKLMRGDVRNPVIEQRFKTERQILAQLDHRNIARLLDGGTTPGGLPYVVMELVVGEPIDRYCAARPLSSRERVQLFLQVCAAVSFAHQHLVVHRDLKPNNILVTADGSVKLLDFGIAKLLEPETATSPSSEETRTQLRAMTLEYASPEQVGGGTMTTASDVYSLGVVLHRLLTGRSPYQATGGDAARVAEILGDTAPLPPGLDEDLDNILLKALRKNPAQRYGSVEQLAADLRRHLAGLPVSARGDSLGYRARKFVWRNRVALAAASLVALSLLAGVGLALREKHLADEQRAIAERHFASVRKLANKLFEFHDEIAALPGATQARQMLVKTSLSYLDALYRQAASDPALRIEVADAYRRLGQIQGEPDSGNIGDSKGALESYRKAIELLEAVRAQEPRNTRAIRMLVSTYSKQIRLQVLGLGEPVADSGRRVVELAESSAPMFTDDYERLMLLVDAYWGSVSAMAPQGNNAQGLTLADRLLSAVEAYVARHPDDLRGLKTADAAYSNIGGYFDVSLPPDDASERGLTLLSKALAVTERRVQLEPDNAEARESWAQNHFNLANTLERRRRYAEALPHFEAAEATLAAHAKDGKDVRAVLVLLMNQSGQAWSLFHTGKAADAEATLLDVEKRLAALTRESDNLQSRFVLACTRIRLGEVLVSRSKAMQARPYLQSGRDGMRAVDAAVQLQGIDREPLETAERLLGQLAGGGK